MTKTASSIIETGKNWSFNWKSRSGQMANKPPSLVGLNIDKKTKEILEAVASVGLITGKQLLSFYNSRERHRDHMCKYDMLVKHQINVTNEERKVQNITVYTLGVNGAKMTNTSYYKVDYWKHYDQYKIYKCIMFFECFHRFKNDFKGAKVYPGIFPFTGAIRLKNAIMEVFVYSNKKDFYDIMNYLRWKSSFNRMIFISNDLNNLHQLKPHLEDKKVRYLKEEDITDGETLKGKFHVLKEREFVMQGS